MRSNGSRQVAEASQGHDRSVQVKLVTLGTVRTFVSLEVTMGLAGTRSLRLTLVNGRSHFYMACPSRHKLRKLVVPMREVRKLCANYAESMRELVVPVRANADTDGHAFVNYS